MFEYWPIVALLIIGFFAEDHYVSRVTVFANSATLIGALNLFETVSVFYLVYTVIGAFFGLLGILKYVQKDPLPDEYYMYSYFLYSSAPVAIVLILGSLSSPGIAVLMISLLSAAVLNSRLLLIVEDAIAPVEDFQQPVRIAVWLWGPP